MPLTNIYLDLLCRLTPEASWNEEKKRRFSRFYDLLISTNSRVNVTSLTSETAVVLKHFADSLSLLQLPCVREAVRFGRSICDVGSGGGFPGIPLAIACPDSPFVMLDSTEKKIRALTENAQLLDLQNVKTVWARGEEAAAEKGDHREKYDVVVSRAVASMPVLSELCLPFVKPGGFFVAMKGARAAEEAALAENAIRRLGGNTPVITSVAFPPVDLSFLEKEERAETEEYLSSSRDLLVIQKVKSTPSGFPRSWAQMIKKSL